eukprot:5955402-Prymnesium_polylepis.2
MSKWDISQPGWTELDCYLQGRHEGLPEAVLVEQDLLHAAFAVKLSLLLLGIRVLLLLRPLLLGIGRRDDHLLQVRLEPEHPAHLPNLARKASRLSAIQADLLLMVLCGDLAQLRACPARAAPEPVEDLADRLDDLGHIWDFRDVV